MTSTRGTKKRKGQVSVLIVLILILVLAVLVAQQINERQKKNEFIDHGHLEMAFEDLPFQKFTSACLEKTMRDGLEYLGEQGGVFDSFERQFLYQGARSVALYLNSSREQLPQKEELEGELAKDVTGNMPHCIRSHLLYKDMSITGNASVILSPTEMTSRFVGTATSGKGEEKQIEARKQIQTEYLHLFETARRIVALQKGAGTEMPLGALSILADEEGVHFTIIQLGSGQFVIALTPEKEGEGGTEEERGTKEERTTEDGAEKGERAGAGTRKKEIFQFGVEYDW